MYREKRKPFVLKANKTRPEKHAREKRQRERERPASRALDGADALGAASPL
jgi:hypothetical protein